MGLGIAAVTGAVPLVAPVPPAAADHHSGCPRTHACYWSSISDQGWSTAGTVTEIGRYTSADSAYNNGTRMRACAYKFANFGDLQISLGLGEYKPSFELRVIDSHKWVETTRPGGCPD